MAILYDKHDICHPNNMPRDTYVALGYFLYCVYIVNKQNEEDIS